MTCVGVLLSAGSNMCRGTYLDEEDVRKIDKKTFNGRTYYQYEAYAPYGSLGPHTLSSVTVKVWSYFPKAKMWGEGAAVSRDDGWLGVHADLHSW
jgi:hypothetical protein